MKEWVTEQTLYTQNNSGKLSVSLFNSKNGSHSVISDLGRVSVESVEVWVSRKIFSGDGRTYKILLRLVIGVP